MNLLYNVCLAIIVLSEESISTLGTFYDFSESTNKVSGFLNSSRLNIYTLRITNLYLYYQWIEFCIDHPMVTTEIVFYPTLMYEKRGKTPEGKNRGWLYCLKFFHNLFAKLFCS